MRSLIPSLQKRFITYGLNPEAELRAEDVRVSEFKTDFKVLLRGSYLGDAKLNVFGRHNAQNALASFAVGMELGMSFEQIRDGLAEFRGIERRLQLKGEGKGITVIDDYGHHPQEIRATLRALKESFGRRLIVIFQPHRYTRTSLLFDDFVCAFGDADLLFVLDIYSAGENPIAGLTSEKLVQAMKDAGRNNVSYTEGHNETIRRVLETVKPGDIVLTLGAGSVWKVGEKIVEEVS